MLSVPPEHFLIVIVKAHLIGAGSLFLNKMRLDLFFFSL